MIQCRLENSQFFQLRSREEQEDCEKIQYKLCRSVDKRLMAEWYYDGWIERDGEHWKYVVRLVVSWCRRDNRSWKEDNLLREKADLSKEEDGRTRGDQKTWLSIICANVCGKVVVAIMGYWREELRCSEFEGARRERNTNLSCARKSYLNSQLSNLF